jgi:nucleolar pre-ribosomal-associated protein 1
VYPHLTALLKLGVYRPITALLGSAVASSLSRRLDVDVTDATLSELVARGDSDAYTLLALLVSLSSKAAEAFMKLAATSDWLSDARILPAISGLSSEQIPAELGEKVTKAAVEALADATLSEEVHTAATRLLTLLPSQANATTAAVRRLSLPSFGPALAKTALALAETGNAEFGAALGPLLDLGLQYATRMLSSDAELSDEELGTLAALQTAVELGAGMRVEPSDPEPAITAAIAERLNVPQALEFAAVLAQRAMLKASFVRQQLQLLVAARELSRLSMPGADNEHRLAFVRITHALFLASTYVSCQPTFVEPLVPLYRGTLGRADRLLLELFFAFEAQRKLSLSSVLQHWSPSGGVSARALDALTSLLDALTSLDPQKVFNSAAAFPLRRTNPPPAGAQVVDDGLPPDANPDDVYDPVFVLALLSSVLQDELGGLDWVEILRSNVLGLAVCALSSRDAGMRRVAGYVLARTVKLISAASFHEQLMLLHTLELVAHSLPAPDNEDAQPRLSPLITLFVAHALRSQAHPSNFLFPLSSRFLLQRPTLDVADVPLLYGMLYAAGDGARRERAWIVRLLRDGVRSNRDAAILARRNTSALLCSLFQSSLDAPFRRAVLAALRSLARTSTGARALLRGSIAPWVRVQWDDAENHPAAEEVRDALLGLLDDAVAAAGTERAAWAGEVAAFVAAVASTERLVPLATLAFRLARADASTVHTTLPPLTKLGDDESATELLFRASLLVPEGEEARLALTLHALAGRVARMQGGVGAWARAEAHRV